MNVSTGAFIFGGFAILGLVIIDAYSVLYPTPQVVPWYARSEVTSHMGESARTLPTEVSNQDEFRCESKQKFFIQRGVYQSHRFRVLVEQQ